MRILPVISGKDKKTMKFGRLKVYHKINIFLKNHSENEAGRLVPDLILFSEKKLYAV